MILEIFGRRKIIPDFRAEYDLPSQPEEFQANGRPDR